MSFELQKTIEILERTPKVLKSFLMGLSDDWHKSDEGENTWSPYDIVGHLIHGEKTDWLVRVKTILGHYDDKAFKPFDRFAQLQGNQNRPISELLEEFNDLRLENLRQLNLLDISKDDLKLKGIHPEFGEVTLKQLIATWATHDLGHIAQISRVMAKQYKADVGPWINYLRILKT